MSRIFDFLNFPLHGSQLIEASAGTGKTFSLALLYTRLVLGHGKTTDPGSQTDLSTAFNRPLTPKEILVVTFTEAAAEELRDRIRARLVEAANFFQQSEARPEGDPLQRLKTDYPPEQWPAYAWKLKLAAESMDEASIATIHGWCNRMLTEHAFDTRGLFNRELVTDQSELLHEVVKDYWRKHFYPLPADQVALVREGYQSPDDLLGALKPVISGEHSGISYQGEPLTITGFDQLQAVFEAQQAYKAADNECKRIEAEIKAAQDELSQTVKDSFQREYSDLKVFLLANRTALKPNNYAKCLGSDEDLIAKLEELLSMAQSDAALPTSGSDFTFLKNLGKNSFAFYKGKEVPLPGLQLFTDIEAWKSPPDLPKKPTKPAAPDLPLAKALLAHAYHWVKQEFSARMQKRAEMGFDDLLTELWRALQQPEQGPHLAASLAKNFPVAMIDEFQDTDPVQYGIFNAIYRVEENPADRGLIMIGDPKQAIYSFRGADIHTYLQARKATEAPCGQQHRHYTLATNYRSTQGIVEACNHLFQHAEKHLAGAFRFKGAEGNPVPYITVDTAGKSDRFQVAGSAVKPLTLFAVEPTNQHEKDESGYLIAQTDYRQQAAEIAASQVVDWLNKAQKGEAGFGDKQVEQPLQPKDIAILVRTGTEARLIRNALHQRNVPSVYLSDRESVFSSAEAADLLHWLRACADPGNESLVRAALGTNTLNLSLEQLAHWRENELAWELQMQTFHNLRHVWYQQGVLALVRELLECYQVAARLLQQADGERALTNILHLAEWLQQASTELRGDQALIRHLAEQIDAKDQQHILRLESDADLVKVITIHKSKGLEYPLVLLPFIGSWRSVDGKTKVVNWRPDRDTSNTFKEVSGSKNFEDAWKQADDERLSEDMRLLYVALTRASHLLWLGVGALKEGNSGSPQIEKSAMGYLLNGGEKIKNPADVIEQYQALVKGCPAINWLDSPPPITTAGYQPASDKTLAPARDPQGLGELRNWWVASYSSISFGKLSSPDDNTGSNATDSLPETDALVPSMNTEPETARQSTAEEFSDEAGDNRPESPLQTDRFIHQFPGGADWGTFLHFLLEWAAEQRTTTDDGWPSKGFAAVTQDERLRKDFIYRQCQLKSISNRAAGLEQWLKDFLQMRWQFNGYETHADSQPPKDLQLAQLPMRQVMVEMEFMFASHQVYAGQIDRLVRRMTLDNTPRPMAQPNVLNGMLKGFIDLVVQYKGRYYVVDWKSNKLGKEDADYTRDSMQAAILKKRYDLQYVLYTLALHRQLKARLPDYDYDRHIGGAVYVFLRGWKADSQGLFYDRPSRQLIESLDRLFAGETEGVCP